MDLAYRSILRVNDLLAAIQFQANARFNLVSQALPELQRFFIGRTAVGFRQSCPIGKTIRLLVDFFVDVIQSVVKMILIQGHADDVAVDVLT